MNTDRYPAGSTTVTTNPAYAQTATNDYAMTNPSYNKAVTYGTPAATVASPYPFSISYLSRLVFALMMWQALCYLGWFIVEIIIHSENDDNNTLGPLTFASMNVYTHEGIIMMGSLVALIYADLIKTRAARVMSCVVQAFCVLAWFWELYYIIPSFRGSDNQTNVFCYNTNGQDDKWCRLNRAASAFSVALEFGQCLIFLYSLANMFMIPVADDGTVKEVEEVDDAEVDAFVAAQPAVYGAADAAEKATGIAILGLCAFSLTGYALVVLASIKIASDTGMTYILSDVALTDMFRQLSLSLVFALAISSYSALRRNRCITAGALFLTILSAFQWWSFFIEACRRFHAQPDISNPNGNYLNDASKVIIAGAGVITCIQSILALGLVCRYYFYVPVQKTHLVPTYQTGAFDFVNPIFSLIFIVQFLATGAWWVLQVVLESDSRLFNDDFNTSSVRVTERMFIYQCMFFAAVFIPAFYAEKWRNVGSYYSAIMINCVIMLGYFLLVWPWSYNTVFTNGALMNGLYANNGFGFCFNNPDNYGHDICRLVQGAAILSVITGAMYVVLALYQLTRVAFFAVDPVDGTATVNPDGTMVAQLGLPPVERKNEFVNLSIILTVCGLAIWSLASIYAVTSTNSDSLIAYTGQGTPISQSGSGSSNAPTLNFFYSYLYTIAYPVIVTLSAATWVACELSQNAYSSNRFGWRLLLTGLSTLCFMFYLPGLIYVSRYVDNGSLSSVQLAEASGWFILSGCSFLLTCAAFVHMFSDYIPVPDRTATVITRDVQLNDVKVDPLNKGAEAGRAAAIADGYQAANQRDIADTTVVENRDPSYNSTVNVH